MESRIELGLRKILGESVDVPEPMSRVEELLALIAEQGIGGGSSGGTGKDGVGIQKIEKTDTQGLIDTYTVTLTDSSTYTFTVTNGKDGTDGTQGQAGTPGENGVTPTIGENGNWFIGDTDTGKPSRGEQGEQGVTGQNGEDGTDGFSPTIVENANNSDSVYKLDITTKTGTLTTPNLKGADGTGGSGEGTTDYTALSNKPKINNVEVTGDKTLVDYGIQASSDSTLNTTDKTIVGAINELYSMITSASQTVDKINGEVV